MNRRNFLRFLGIGAVATVAAPFTPFPQLKQKEIKLDISGVCTRNRKLKAVWSIEAEQDLRANHSIEAEKQLTEMMSRQIMDEIAIHI